MAVIYNVRWPSVPFRAVLLTQHHPLRLKDTFSNSTGYFTKIIYILQSLMFKIKTTLNISSPDAQCFVETCEMASYMSRLIVCSDYYA
jgi:hypothetical protein